MTTRTIAIWRRTTRSTRLHGLAVMVAGWSLCLALAASCQAQGPTRSQAPPARSLAERLSQIRFGWGRGDDSATESTSQAASSPRNRSATGANSPVRLAARPQANRSPGAAPLPTNKPTLTQRPAPTGQRSQLPSLDPRNLLPKDLFVGSHGGSVSNKAAQAKPVASNKGAAASRVAVNQESKATDPSTASAGSARERIMRDLRQRGAEAAVAPTNSTAKSRYSNARYEKPTPKRVASNEKQPASAPTNVASKASPSEERRASDPPHPTTVARRAPARAGSILSRSTPTLPELSGPGPQRPAASSPTALGPAYSATPTLRPSSVNTYSKRALTKSLAAEIAREMAEQVEASGPTDQGNKVDQDSSADEVASSENVESEENESDEDESAALAAGLVDQSRESQVAASAVSEGTDDANQGVAEDVTPQVVAQVDMSTQRLETDSTLTAKPAVEASEKVSAEANPAGDPIETIELGVDRATEIARSHFSDAKDSAVGIAQESSNPANLLLTEKAPLVVSRVNGPRQITIGQGASYSVVLANRGDAAAEGLITRVRIPEWADVVETSTSKGSVQQRVANAGGGLIEWNVGQFNSRSTAKLDMTLVAREGKPIELGVDWNHDPVGGKTLVEVQEPKLEIAVTGPEEVLFGKPQRYRLKLSNPGTGAAEDVIVHLLPPGKSPDQASRHPIGSIAAGVTKFVEIELTARDAGELAILARATATGGLEASAEKRMLCLKPELEVDWRGPARKYSGAVSTYYFRVRNPGTATAERVTFVVDLPEGFQLQATSNGQSYDPAKRRLAWNVKSLRPGDDTYLQIRGVPTTAGEQKFPITAATADRLTSHTVTATTEVVALADLKLEIRDPKGPVPVGTDVVYEVRVKNRGANVAEKVNLVAMFSAGIEPHAVDGAACASTDGRVALKTIDRLDAGSERVFKITARADKVGTHVFRAEVLCRELETKLAAEEMTRFYAEETLDMGEGPRAAGSVNRFVYPR